MGVDIQIKVTWHAKKQENTTHDEEQNPSIKITTEQA